MIKKFSDGKISRWKRAKYPALKKEYNTKARRYYIETDYIDGTFDSDGKMVIRPLTEDEKDWLNKFYLEVLVTNFKKDGSDFYDSDQERRALYRDNNNRNVDLYNLALRTGKLVKFDTEEYDRYSAECLKNLDYELALINEIEPPKRIKKLKK